MTNEVKEAIKLIESALNFYAESFMSYDEKKAELDNAWNIVKEKRNYGNGCDDSNSIAIIWEIQDIKDKYPDLDDDKCMQVLRYAERNHDSEFGISWETLDSYIGELSIMCWRKEEEA